MTEQLFAPTTIAFRVPGLPAPQGSKAFKGFTPSGRAIMAESAAKTLDPWRKRIAMMAHNQMQGQAPHTGPITMQLDFVLRRPKSTPKRRTPPAIKKPDSDKLARAVFDALTGVIYRDDSQVIDHRVTKRLADLGENPGVTIRIEAE